jgi:uncharacterized protein YacL
MKINPRTLKNVQIENIDTDDIPDMVNAIVTYAEHANGEPLTEVELDYLNNDHSDYVQERAYREVFDL